MFVKSEPLTVSWRPDNNPLAAREIAEHVKILLEQMGHADAKKRSELYDGFKLYAARKRVCAPICQHVTDKFFGLLRADEAAKKFRERQP